MVRVFFTSLTIRLYVVISIPSHRIFYFTLFFQFSVTYILYIAYFFMVVVIVITGTTRGIGVETARVLALRGVHVIMGVRNMNAAKDVKETILKEIPTAKVDAMELDLSSMESVRKFASEFNSSGLPLNILM